MRRPSSTIILQPCFPTTSSSNEKKNRQRLSMLVRWPKLQPYPSCCDNCAKGFEHCKNTDAIQHDGVVYQTAQVACAAFCKHKAIQSPYLLCCEYLLPSFPPNPISSSVLSELCSLPRPQTSSLDPPLLSIYPSLLSLVFVHLPLTWALTLVLALALVFCLFSNTLKIVKNSPAETISWTFAW